MLNNFIHAKTKSLFLEHLGTGNLPDDAIGFIEDSKEIWNRGVFYGRADNIIISGDGTRFLSDSGEYKEISIPSFEVPTKISELENDKGYLVKVVLTQAEYDALETKDPNALYVISDANETEDNNFVTEAQLESRGFLTQTDRSELKEYDDFLLGKISDLESKLTAALGRIATLESELENTLKV